MSETNEATEVPGQEPEAPAPSPEPRKHFSGIKELLDQEWREKAEKKPAQPALDLATMSWNGVPLSTIQAPAEPDPQAELAAKVAELDAFRNEQLRKAEEERRESHVRSLEAGVVSWINESDQYPLTREAGAGSQVFAHMVETYRKNNGVEISDHEAAAHVEQRLVELVTKLAPLLPKSDGTAGSEQPQTQPVPPTLTNRQATEVHTTKPLTRDERMRQAMDILSIAHG